MSQQQNVNAPLVNPPTKHNSTTFKKSLKKSLKEQQKASKAQLEQNKQEDTNQFMSRIDKMYSMFFPINTPSKLVVLPNSQALGFRFDCYDKQICKDKIKLEEFNQTVKESTKICEKLWMKKKMEETSDYNATLKKVLYAAILISLTAFILLLVLIYGICNNYETIVTSQQTFREYEECNYDGVLWTSIGLLILSGVMAVFVVLAGLFTDPTFIELDKTIMQELQESLDKRNLQNKNVKWELGPDYFYLQLSILTGREEDAAEKDVNEHGTQQNLKEQQQQQPNEQLQKPQQK